MGISSFLLTSHLVRSTSTFYYIINSSEKCPKSKKYFMNDPFLHQQLLHRGTCFSELRLVQHLFPKTYCSSRIARSCFMFAKKVADNQTVIHSCILRSDTISCVFVTRQFEKGFYYNNLHRCCTGSLKFIRAEANDFVLSPDNHLKFQAIDFKI